MLKKFLAAGCLLMFTSCAHVSQVDFTSGISDEIREGDNREGISVGVDTKLKSGIKVGTKYRYRTSDFQLDPSNEHGFFLNVKIPIWKAKK